MDLILSAAFVRFDAWFLVINLFLLVAASVSYVVEKLFWLFRVVSPVSQAARSTSPASSEMPVQIPEASASDATDSSIVSEVPVSVPNKKSKKASSEAPVVPSDVSTDSLSVEGSKAVVDSASEPAPVPKSEAETVEKDDADVPASS